MHKYRILFICLSMITAAACGESSSSKECSNNSECSDPTPICSTETGKCEAAPQDETKCHSNNDCTNDDKPVCDTQSGQCIAKQTSDSKCQSDSDCQSPTPVCRTETGKCEAECMSDDDCSADAPKCSQDTGKCEKCSQDDDCPDSAPVCTDTGKCIKCSSNDDCKNSNAKLCSITSGKCVECLINNDCSDEKPRCIAETSTCETASYGKNECQTDEDCTDSFYSVCNTEIHECTSPCEANKDCRICREEIEKCVETDIPICNKTTHFCETYSDCSVNSSNPCYTKCTDEKDEYYAWINGNLVNKKCKDNSCSVSQTKIGIEPDTCEPYSTPPKSCNPETSATLCSPDGKSVWACDSMTNSYYEQTCDAETEHCVQCQNLAGCIPFENCTKDSTQECNAVCNEEGDGFYIWDINYQQLMLVICPKSDCISICGTAQCKSAIKIEDNTPCAESFKYCSKDGAFAFSCENGKIVKNSCINNDCIYDSENNIITSCTIE